MTDDPISRLNAALEGRYRVERELGEGGMATVYLAADLKHERKVALKVLKPELAAVVGADRFLAEIKTTANLQHPHILPLFDSGEAGGFLFYVMPYVEGESLREKLDREAQLGVEEAVVLTRKVADALDYAHENGVVHRDIKPGNILLSPRGEPLVADFGIALAVAQAGGGRITETGLSLGTPHYMSPEQATGDRDVDPRSDLYALGCVLYEMLAGEPPFSAGTAQAILAKILTMDAPSITMVRRTVPPNVGAALAKSLEKLPADRFASVAEFAAALVDEGYTYRARTRVSASAASPEYPASTTRPGPWNRLSVTMTVVAAAAALVGVWGWLRPMPDRGVATRVELADTDLEGVGGWRIEISPDGRWIVKVEDETMYIRSSDNPEWRVLDNAERGLFPTFSPNGQWVAFSREGIWKVSINGGPALPVASEGSGPRWGSDDTIVYTDDAGRLYRVASSGGAPELLLDVDSVPVRTPQLLPDGRGVIFSLAFGASASRVLLLDIETGDVRELVSGGNQPRYVETGHLIYGYEGALMGVAFDLGSLQVTGTPVTLLPSLQVFSGGSSQFAVSQTGMLAYRTGGQGSGAATPVWVERDGTAREIEPGWTVTSARSGSSVAVSPSGDRLAISIPGSSGTTDLWVKPLDTGPPSRLTFEGQSNRRPEWAPDGQSLLFVSDRAGQNDLWTKRADGSGSAALVLDQEFGLAWGRYSPDGTWLVSQEGGRAGRVFAAPVGEDGAVGAPTATEAVGRSASLSPDGRWLAFVDEGTGRPEVYVRPFPNTGEGLAQVSTDGGQDPVWAHNGRELFYRNGANELVAVQYTGDPTFAAGRREVLFPMNAYLRGSGWPMYAVSPDDQRFVMLRVGTDDEEAGATYLVTNWFTELRERMGENR